MSRASETREVTLLVIAKEPLPGRAKTRLAPALGAEGAARLAAAALADTLEAVAAVRPSRPLLLALDGEPGPWLPPAFRVVPQRGEGLAERLAAAFEDAGGPAFLVGMDTPQIDPATIERCCAALCRERTDAVLGLAEDGGWWGLGLQRPDRRAFSGVPMSEARTGEAQIAALDALGLRWRELERLRDVDTIEDARTVARQAPATRFAATLERLAAGTPGARG